MHIFKPKNRKRKYKSALNLKDLKKKQEKAAKKHLFTDIKILIGVLTNHNFENLIIKGSIYKKQLQNDLRLCHDQRSTAYYNVSPLDSFGPRFFLSYSTPDTFATRTLLNSNV